MIIVPLDWPRYEVTAVMVGSVEFLGSGPEPGESRTAPASSRWRIVVPAPVQFVLQSIKHISVEDLYDATSYSTKPIRFPTGYVAGTLIGADGQPILGADVKIYATSELSYPLANATSYTNAKGQFQFAVAPGDYVIGFNIFEPPSAEAPYPPTYYLSTRQRAKATVVSVADNQHVSDLVFKLPPPLAPRIIPVEVLWPDGKPVGEAMVLLSQEIEPQYVEGKLVGHTAVDGTLDVSGFEGIDYVLHADKYAGPLELGLLPQGDPIACSKNLSIPAEPIPSHIQFFLTITDRDVCKNFLGAPASRSPSPPQPIHD